MGLIRVVRYGGGILVDDYPIEVHRYATGHPTLLDPLTDQRWTIAPGESAHVRGARVTHLPSPVASGRGRDLTRYVRLHLEAPEHVNLNSYDPDERAE